MSGYTYEYQPAVGPKLTIYEKGWTPDDRTPAVLGQEATAAAVVLVEEPTEGAA